MKACDVLARARVLGVDAVAQELAAAYRVPRWSVKEALAAALSGSASEREIDMLLRILRRRAAFVKF